MSKLIVEMEMPQACSWIENGVKKRCPIAEWGGACAITKQFEYPNEKRPSWCPIKGVLPDEHGDLIDRDKAKDAFDSSFLTFRMKDGETMRGFYKRTIAELPTVIAAERKDDDK